MKFLGALLVLLTSVSVVGEDLNGCPSACDRPKDCRREFYIGSKKIDVYSNYPLNVTNRCIDSVLYAVHGSSRDAEPTYDAVIDSAKSLGVERRVLIISPYFRADVDLRSSKDYYWTTSGWKKGNTSTNSGTQLSSFAVGDSILANVIDGGRFPNLVRATATGHSAGGQYTQMYALTTSAPDDHPEIDFQFVVLNPSNYTYLNTLRPYPEVDNYFELPIYWDGSQWQMKPVFEDAAGSCVDSYNDFKYGLDSRNSYASRLSSSALIEQYLTRHVYYYLGELDNDPNHISLDTTCPAELQGPHRLARGINYFNFLNAFFPTHQHDIGFVPGVAHSARGMYNSDELRPLLFWLN